MIRSLGKFRSSIRVPSARKVALPGMIGTSALFFNGWLNSAFCTSASTENTMEYRMMGGTGLKVSVLSFGFWATFGVKEGTQKAIDIMQACRDAGVNLYDNAETYGSPSGEAEKVMGEALQWLMGPENPKSDMWRRTEIIVTTKIFWAGSGQNETGLSRKHIMEGMNNSLKRLQLDYVDIVFAHRPDPLTPIEETVRAFTQVIREGKACYWGTSEWTPQQITEAFWVAKLHGLEAPVVEQPQYNMFVRDNMEKDMLPLFKAPYGIGTTIWSPLKSGILTGKYNKGIPKGSRFDTKGYAFLKERWDNQKADQLPKVEKLMELSEKLGCSVGQLAIAWCAKNKNVSTVLLGATKMHQIEENLGALDLARRLDEKTMAEIDEILGNVPSQPLNYGRECHSTL